MDKKVKRASVITDFAYGYVSTDGGLLMRTVCRHKDGSDELLKAIFKCEPNHRHTIRPLIVIEDTPANRKRLGVK